jgi:FixJ family two-component response regulator
MNERGRILIADDEETFLHSTIDLLKDQGYGCQGVQDAPSALSILSVEEFDLLVCDINMPGNSHLEFVDQILQSRPDFPVIVITGYPSVATAVQSFRLSAVDYLQKPLDFTLFLSLVERTIQKRKIFQTVESTRTQVLDLMEAMDSLGEMGRSSMKSHNKPMFSSAVTEYVGQTVNYLATVSLGLKSVFDVVQKGHGVGEEVLNQICPQCQTYREGLHETISVLNKTRTSFKSKDLGELRRRTENLLNHT